MKNILIIFILLSLSWNQLYGNDKSNIVYDVVIYGSTPAGIAAAVTAARNDRSSIILDPHFRPGGLPASGMSNTDFSTYDALGGIWREFMDSVKLHYKSTYGPNSTEFRDCRNGARYEPKVALRIFKNMMDKTGVKTDLGHVLYKTHLNEEGSKIQFVELRDIVTNEIRRIKGKIFIDATYEGDLMAMASEEYFLGAESRDQYNESLAPEKANDHVMAYNFRVPVTKDPKNKIKFYKPKDYYIDDLPLLADGFKTGRFKDLEDVIQIISIPINKANLNDRHASDCESFMLYNLSDVWPEATYKERQDLKEIAKFKAQSYFYFLSNDQRIPYDVRREMSQWGYPKDECISSDHFPSWLYIREGRRMIGQYIFTQHDARPAEGSVRAPAHESGIAIGHYGFNSHGSHLDAQGHKVGVIKGEGTVPYQIPYEVILPKRTDNLLVPVAVSASRVGYSTIRMEPTWTALGEAAGMAAVVSFNQRKTLENIDIRKLQIKLHKAGAITFYTSDVPPGSKYYNAVQFLGNREFFQRLYPDTLGAQAGSSYHDINPDKTLSEELRSEWISLSGQKFGTEVKKNALEISRKSKTRGEFIRKLYENIRQQVIFD